MPLRLAFQGGTLRLEGLARDEAPPELACVWDEREHVFRAPAIDYAALVLALRARGLAYTDDARKYATLSLVSSLKQQAFPYQEEALARWRAQRCRGVVVLPTGAGKTFVAARLLLANHVREGGRVLWLAHRRSLLRQAARTFLAHADAAHPRSPIGLLTISGDDARWPSVRPEHDAVFSSIQTAAREDRIDFVEAFLRMRETRTFVVVDEAHHASAPGYYRLLSELRRLGSDTCLGLVAAEGKHSTPQLALIEAVQHVCLIPPCITGPVERHQRAAAPGERRACGG